ncbi:MAG: hypothetical protein ABR576_12185 [Thermoanaerobaculia bacterium]
MTAALRVDSDRRRRLLLGALLAFLVAARAAGQAAPAADRDRDAVAAARRLVQSWMAVRLLLL